MAGMQKYDVTVLCASGGAEKLVEKVEKLVAALGGKVAKVTEMGKKQLAYKIGTAREADFTGFTIELPGDVVVQLDKKLTVDRDVLRHLLVKAGKI